VPRPPRVEPGPGQESVWDYPRPPALEPTTAHLEVVFGGVTIADTRRAYRVLETSHPPNYYFPPDDVMPDALVRTDGSSFCEWKGRAHYFDVRVNDRLASRAAWGCDAPSERFAAIRGYVAFYPGLVDACFVDGERVTPQDGGFYGGWVTSTVVGPFKGGAGTRAW
jgi:uncharacterized protein (DUF427 family)